MHAMTVRLTSHEAPLERHSSDLAAREGFTRGPIHQFELLDDGSAIELRAVSGDLAAYREVTASEEGVREVVVSGDDEGFVYAHFEPSAPTRALLEWRQRSDLVLEMPIHLEDDHTCRLTLVGDASSFRNAIGSLPEGVSTEVLSTGPYRGSDEGVFGSLTATQRDVLAAAVEQGYYALPREATQADLAAVLDCSPATVGEHLRKIEAQVLTRFDPGGP